MGKTGTNSSNNGDCHEVFPPDAVVVFVNIMNVSEILNYNRLFKTYFYKSFFLYNTCIYICSHIVHVISFLINACQIEKIEADFSVSFTQKNPGL